MADHAKQPRGRVAGEEIAAGQKLLRAKENTTVSLVLPARDEEATVGAIVNMVRETLMRRTGGLVLDGRHGQGGFRGRCPRGAAEGRAPPPARAARQGGSAVEGPRVHDR
jgi:hypothetical protein